MGRLTEADGKPVTGPVDLEGDFYRAATGGVPLGATTMMFKNTALADGTFQIILSLASTDFAAVFGNGSVDVYLELTDVTHQRILPRQRLLAVPYAMRVPTDGKTLLYDDQNQLTVGPAAAPVTGQFLTRNGAGEMTWAVPNSSSVITAVVAGTGLTGGGASGTVTLNVANLAGSLVTAGTFPTSRLPTSTSTTSGVVTAANWLLFNAKENAVAGGTTSQYFRGDKTWATLNTSAVPEGTNQYYSDARVRTATLANGLVDGVTTFAPSQDAVVNALELKQATAEKNANNGYVGLDATGKIVSDRIPFSSVTYLGGWNASNNTPTLANNCVGHSPNNYFIVATAGATTLNGISGWGLGDWAICSSANVWQRVGSSGGGLTSINSKTGASTVLDTGDLAENGNLFYTTARTTADARSAVSATAPIGYSSGVFSLANANSSTSGAVSSGDWTAFNGKVGGGATVGAGGVGFYKQTSAGTLQLRSVNGATNKISVALDAPNNEVDVDVVEANLSLANVSGTLGTSKGGTSSASLTDHGILLGNGTGAMAATAAMTDGQLLVGSTGAAPSPTTVTQGANLGVTLTAGAGSLALGTVQDIRATASPTFAGLSLTGALTLPSNGLTVGTTQLAASGGNVGVGTSAPVALLDVDGLVRLTPQADIATCDVGHAGSVSMTSVFHLCVCNGTSWVEVLDGATACTWGKLSLTYSGSSQSFVVPSGVTSITVKIWGAGGGGGGSEAGLARSPGIGGGAGFTKTTLTTTPGETLTVIVGGGGSGGAQPAFGGGGGGYSVIKRSGTSLASAGGGGGGAGPSTLALDQNGGAGGDGGGSAGEAGSGNAAGRGATVSANGAGGSGNVNNGSPGTDEFGGNASNSTSGTIGGFNGGGKGGSRNASGNGGPGGGGAGYHSGGGGGQDNKGAGGAGSGGGNATGTGTVQSFGAAGVPANSSDPDIVAGVGAGGTAGTATVPSTGGGPGLVVISW